jgi:hypothetical protein
MEMIDKKFQCGKNPSVAGFLKSHQSIIKNEIKIS